MSADNRSDGEHMRNEHPESKVATRIDTDDSRWLTPREAATLLCCAVSSLATWRCRGKGPPYRIVGRSCFYVAAECIAWRNEKARAYGLTPLHVDGTRRKMESGDTPGRVERSRHLPSTDRLCKPAEGKSYA